MADERAVKAAKAKLYNLRSSIDGIIPLLETGVLKPKQVGMSISALAAKAVDELDKHLESSD